MSSSDSGRPATGGRLQPSLYGTSALPLNTWSHLAATYDGATLRLYVNGVQVASQAVTAPIGTSTGALTIGGDALYGQYFAGRIDEVRIYNTALSAGRDPGGHGDPDRQPRPSGHAAADGADRPDGDGGRAATQINLAWTAATDNVGVTGYRVERCQGAGCSNFAQIATPSGTTFNDTGLTAATSYSYRVRATDAAGNLSGYSSVAERDDAGGAGHAAADGARGPDGDGGVARADQSGLDAPRPTTSA